MKIANGSLTVLDAWNKLGELLASNPECSSWPVYSDGCDCIEPASGWSLNPEANIGAFVSLDRDQENRT